MSSIDSTDSIIPLNCKTNHPMLRLFLRKYLKSISCSSLYVFLHINWLFSWFRNSKLPPLGFDVHLTTFCACCLSSCRPMWVCVCALLWQFPLTLLLPDWWAHCVFSVLPYRWRSILNSRARPAYPSTSAVYLSSRYLPRCQSLTIWRWSRPPAHLILSLSPSS